jgi:hypothetical protein
MVGQALRETDKAYIIPTLKLHLHVCCVLSVLKLKESETVIQKQNLSNNLFLASNEGRDYLQLAWDKSNANGYLSTGELWS